MESSHDWIFTDEFILNSASRKDDISYEDENGYRSKTIWFMEDLGKAVNWLLLILQFYFLFLMNLSFYLNFILAKAYEYF
jgi:hypothetical protein